MVVRIEGMDGKILEFVTDEQWVVSSQEVSGWQAADFDDSSWKKAIVAASLETLLAGNQTPADDPSPARLSSQGVCRRVFADQAEAPVCDGAGHLSGLYQRPSGSG